MGNRTPFCPRAVPVRVSSRLWAAALGLVILGGPAAAKGNPGAAADIPPPGRTGAPGAQWGPGAPSPAGGQPDATPADVTPYNPPSADPAAAPQTEDVVYVIGGAGARNDTLSDDLVARYGGIENRPAGPPIPLVPARERALGDAAAEAPVAEAAQTAAPGRAGLGGVLSEVRVGALVHDVGFLGSDKEDGIDLNAELLFVSPDILDIVLAPRPHLGVSANTEGNTSQIYAGLAWDWNFRGPFFVEGTLALALHDGELDIESRREKALGCRVLFRESVSLGVRFRGHHSLSVMLAHISNADICDDNEGLATVGLRYGYRF